MKSPQLKLSSRTQESVIRTVYNIDWNSTTYYLSDFASEGGSVVDTYVRDIYGNLIEDPEIVQTLINFIDNSEEKN